MIKNISQQHVNNDPTSRGRWQVASDVWWMGGLISIRNREETIHNWIIFNWSEATDPRMRCLWPGAMPPSLPSRAWNEPSRSLKFHNHWEAPYWGLLATRAFTFKTLCLIGVKLGHQCKDHKGWAGWLSKILKAAGPIIALATWFVYLLWVNSCLAFHQEKKWL